MEPRIHLTPGTAFALTPQVRRLVAGNAGLMTGPGTNTYLLGEREIAVLDPGPANARHLNHIVESAGAPIRWILTTHTHSDHSPLARELSLRTGARLIGVPPPRDGRQDMTFAPEHVPGDGEQLELGDLRLIAIRTPGHASNCVCYLLESARMLFTGDHVLEGVSPVILPPDGDMAAYLDSIAKLKDLPFDRIAPGHGGVIEDAHRTLDMLRKHRLMREAKVINALREAGRADIAALTPKVYDDVPQERHSWAQLTLEAHLIKLRRDKRVEEHSGVWQLVEA
jgi:glyoxylase-like metal-dependent hydrolase (beta-lactamase superfamily II)